MPSSAIRLWFDRARITDGLEKLKYSLLDSVFNSIDSIDSIFKVKVN